MGTVCDCPAHRQVREPDLSPGSLLPPTSPGPPLAVCSGTGEGVWGAAGRGTEEGFCGPGAATPPDRGLRSLKWPPGAPAIGGRAPEQRFLEPPPRHPEIDSSVEGPSAHRSRCLEEVLEGEHHGWNVCVPPESLCWSPNTPRGGVGGRPWGGDWLMSVQSW